MWKGTAETLKAMPAMTKTIPNSSPVETPSRPSAEWIWPNRVEPVKP
jgi:hypothetical protein